MSESAKLELDRVDFAGQRLRLVQEKNSLQASLAEINAKCRITLPLKEFQSLQSKRKDIILQINERENGIQEINQRLREIAATESINHEASFSRNAIKELRQMRDKYHEFSMDDKNSQAARRIFWAVSQELRDILKPYFAKKEEDAE